MYQINEIAPHTKIYNTLEEAEEALKSCYVPQLGCLYSISKVEKIKHLSKPQTYIEEISLQDYEEVLRKPYGEKCEKLGIQTYL